jgi:hypothetical protein
MLEWLERDDFTFIFIRHPVLDTGFGYFSGVAPEAESQGPAQVRADDSIRCHRALVAVDGALDSRRRGNDEGWWG